MRAGTARGNPIASNWSQDIVPLVSVRSTWSTEMPISWPASALPATRWLSMSFRVRLLPIQLDWGGASAAPPPDPPTDSGTVGGDVDVTGCVIGAWRGSMVLGGRFESGAF